MGESNTPVTQARDSFSRATGRPIPKLSACDHERFWRNVEKSDGCWNWTGYKIGRSTHRYGGIGVGGEYYLAHRISYAIRHGGMPEGKVVDHKCRNTLCVNPDHLEAVSSAENTRRGRAYPSNCRRGHPLSGDNVRWVGKQRRCRACQRIRTQKWRGKANA